jgi:hypothetical protein
MIRTLTLVSVLALIAGVSMGFFIASAADRSAADPSTAGKSPATALLDTKVKGYVDRLGLSPSDEQEIRSTLMEYDQRIADVFRRLQQQHRDEFKALTERANARINAVVAKYPRKSEGK